MKQILLLTDFSKNATNAINYALALFKDEPCEYTVLNIQKTSDFTTDDIYAASPGTTVYESVIADNSRALDAYIAELETRYGNGDIRFNGIVDYDVFTDAVNQAVTANNIDYVVMGTNGATGAREVLFGSNTLQVIRNVVCPTLVVPESFDFRPINKLLYTQSHELQFKSADFAPLLALLKNNSVQINMLGIHPKEHNNSLDANLNQLKEAVFLDWETQIKSLDGLDVPTAVSAYQQLEPVDLHVFFAEPESVFKRLFYGSEMGQVSYQTLIPLLVLPH